MFTVGFQYNFRQKTAVFQVEDYQLLLSDMLKCWCSWFKYRLIKLVFNSPRYGHMILVSGYLVLTGVNRS